MPAAAAPSRTRTRAPAQRRGAAPRIRLARSLALKARAARVIPGCSQTFSKGPTQFVQGASPVFLSRGRGAHVWDVDGQRYLDYSMALGAVILGYGDATVDAAVRRQGADGGVFSLPHPLEVEVAERLAALIPCAEMVRFGKNGSDVTAGAVRLARAVTGREIIAACGYHGWQDWYIGTTTRRRGVPKAVQALTKPFLYNDLESLRRIFAEHPGQVAGVILEPVGVDAPQAGFLEGVRRITEREGAVLIFDEVLTGFRTALGGAQAHYGVTPDLACFGKAMANGWPLSALVGRRNVMRELEDVFFSFTFGGEALSLAACGATLRVLARDRVVPRLWRTGEQLRDGYNRLAAARGLSGATVCRGLGPRTVVAFPDASGGEDLVLKSLFQQECIARGVLWGGAHNMSACHGEREVAQTLRVYGEALDIIAEARARGDAGRRLRGPAVEPVFRKP